MGADTVTRADTALELHGAALVRNITTMLAFCRTLRTTSAASVPDGLTILEDLLFVVSIDLQAYSSLVAARLKDYGELAESVSAAVDGVDRFPLPPLAQPAAVLVYTGSYVPTPANDRVGGAQ